MEHDATLDPFDEAVTGGKGLLHEAIGLLEPELGVLTDEERTHLLPVSDDLPGAIAKMLEETELLARLAPACPKFDADQVAADLRDAKRVELLANRVEYLTRLVGDARRVRLARAYAGALSVYNVAKAVAEHDATVLPLVLPLQELYADRKKPAKKAAEPKTETRKL